MAYERYIDKNNRLYIVLRRWHKATIVNGEALFYPTEVEVLAVHKEQTTNLKHVDFEEKVSSGILKRVTK